MSSSLPNKSHSYPSSGVATAHRKLAHTTRERIIDKLQTQVKNRGFISQMNLWIKCCIKPRSLIFRALLNPPIATLRWVSVILSCFFFFFWCKSSGREETDSAHCIQGSTSIDLEVIWFLQILKTIDAFTCFSCLVCLEWSMPLLKRTCLVFCFL